MRCIRGGSLRGDYCYLCLFIYFFCVCERLWGGDSAATTITGVFRASRGAVVGVIRSLNVNASTHTGRAFFSAIFSQNFKTWPRRFYCAVLSLSIRQFITNLPFVRLFTAIVQ